MLQNHQNQVNLFGVLSIFYIVFLHKNKSLYECLTHKNHIFSREIYNTIISSQNKESNDFPFSFVNLGFHLYKVEWKIFQLSIA